MTEKQTAFWNRQRSFTFVGGALVFIVGCLVGGRLAVGDAIWGSAVYTYVKDLGSFIAAFVAVLIAVAGFWFDKLKTLYMQNRIQMSVCNVLLAELAVCLQVFVAEHQKLRKENAKFMRKYTDFFSQYDAVLSKYVTTGVQHFDSQFIQKIAVHDEETKRAYEWYNFERTRNDIDMRYYDALGKFFVINILMYMCTLSGQPSNDENKRALLNKYEVKDADIYITDIATEMDMLFKEHK